jgi:excisionase family DNA binding protein
MHQPSPRATSSARRTEWLSLGPAARLLGVDADTLRRWADAGRIEAFTTPGGHRRFSQRSIDGLIAARRSGVQVAPSPLGATTERLSAAYRRRALSQPRFRLATPLDRGLREALRSDGRGLVDALIRYLDASDSVERAGIEAEATELSVDLARRLAAAGLPLPDAVARFVVAREPLLDEIVRAAHRRRVDVDRLAAVFSDASSILDRLLLAFIAAHEAAHPVRPVERTTAAAPATRSRSR